ncbi:MAG: DUF3090 family protein [Chloroflexi bacterium]|nr:DUF3090 family protein [Chloroflexota bacterium]
MTEVRHELGPARLFQAEAQGKPGKRTFRLMVEAPRGTASVWLEKEQLSALALQLKGFLESQAARRDIGKMPEGVAATGREFEVKAVALALTYREQEDAFGILIADEADAKARRVTLGWWVTREQAGRFARQALEVVTAGRPACPLCHEPMNPEGHACAKTNGHGKLTGEFR